MGSGLSRRAGRASGWRRVLGASGRLVGEVLISLGWDLVGGSWCVVEGRLSVAEAEGWSLGVEVEGRLRAEEVDGWSLEIAVEGRLMVVEVEGRSRCEDVEAPVE